MSLDKTLNKIQAQINELAPTLELFVEESIQPSVKDCEALQELLNKLQENLAVYKYHKMEREISPSFSIHAKVSGNIDHVKNENTMNPALHETQVNKNNNENTHGLNSPENFPPLSFGINDKFRFVNELFKQNMAEYNIVIEQLNSMHSWQDSETYLSSLKPIYNWKDNSEELNLFFAQVKKRFMQ
jgi:hypothetical protein